VKRPEVASLLAACLLMAVTHGPYYTSIRSIWSDHGYDKSTVGWLWALGVLCEIGISLSSRASSPGHAARLILASFALAVLRFLLIAWGWSWPGSFGRARRCTRSLRHVPCGGGGADPRHFPRRHQAAGRRSSTACPTASAAPSAGWPAG